jgi:hypothetical protein
MERLPRQLSVQVTAWKTQLLEGAASVFGNARALVYQRMTSRNCAKIGDLTLQPNCPTVREERILQQTHSGPLAI